MPVVFELKGLRTRPDVRIRVAPEPATTEAMNRFSPPGHRFLDFVTACEISWLASRSNPSQLAGI